MLLMVRKILRMPGTRHTAALLTLDEALADQERLDSICADRPLHTAELFKPNAYYGIDRIFKRYAGLPDMYALKAVVPHGIHIGVRYVWDKERDAPLPVIFCYPSFRQHAYMAQSSKVIIPSASPFLYVMAMLRDQPRPERRGTIFFPVHSMDTVTVVMDFEQLAERLANLDAEYQPVTVCVYWKDYLLGHHLPFQKRGMRVVSAGHRYDPNFLFRLYHLCSQHRYASGNRVGSHLFLSAAAGCAFFSLHMEDFHFVGGSEAMRKNMGQSTPEMWAELKHLFETPRPALSAQQRAVVDHYMGAEAFQSPQALRRQLIAAEVLDKLGSVTYRQRVYPVLTPPSVARRVAERATSFTASAQKDIRRLHKRLIMLWRRMRI
jgi:hypothetical protein